MAPLSPDVMQRSRECGGTRLRQGFGQRPGHQSLCSRLSEPCGGWFVYLMLADNCRIAYGPQVAISRNWLRLFAVYPRRAEPKNRWRSGSLSSPRTLTISSAEALSVGADD